METKPRRSRTVRGILCIRHDGAAEVTDSDWQRKSARKCTLTNWNCCNEFVDQQTNNWPAHFCTVCMIDGVIFLLRFIWRENNKIRTNRLYSHYTTLTIFSAVFLSKSCCSAATGLSCSCLKFSKMLHLSVKVWTTMKPPQEGKNFIISIWKVVS